jgi:hypothetical protein
MNKLNPNTKDIPRFENVKLSPDLERLAKISRRNMIEQLEQLLVDGKLTHKTTIEELIAFLSQDVL